MTSLDRLFRPRSIAVVGASANAEKLGHTLLKNLLSYGYAGRVHPVNPAGGRILGRRAYARLADVPRPLDLVLVSVPNRAVTDVLAQSDGAAFGVVLSSGFGEMAGGPDLRPGRMRLVGPNCMGVYSIRDRLNATYFWELPREPGGVAFVSQSGAYGGMLFSEARRRGIGIHKFVSVGNQADLVHADFVEHLADDSHAAVLALFVEQVRDGARLLRATARAARRRPVVVFKAGRTKAGARAAASHTASIAGDDDVFRAALTQAGATLAETTEEFFDLIAAFDAYPRARLRPRAIAVCTISGGPSVIAADAAETQGLPVPVLSDATRRRVRALVPPFGADSNPVDMTPQMEPANFGGCVRAVLSDRAIGGAVAINVGLDRPEFAEAFAGSKKPVVAFTVDAPQIAERFRRAGIPIFPTPERAVRALRALADRPKPDLPALGTATAAGAGRTLDWFEARTLLRRFGVPMCPAFEVASLPDALAAARRAGYPVALKAAAAHKSDRGGVALGLRGPRDVARAFRALRRFGRLALQPMVAGDLEAIVGARRDEAFGPVVALGPGGVFAEAMGEPALRLCPVDAAGARAMTSRFRAFGAFRGRAAVAPALENIIRAVSRLMSARPDVLEIDLNPLRLSNGRATAVDALVVVRKP